VPTLAAVEQIAVLSLRIKAPLKFLAATLGALGEDSANIDSHGVLTPPWTSGKSWPL
jgi:hypothetical protein